MSRVVRYSVGPDTTVQFEIEPLAGYQPAGAAEVVGEIKTAVEPAVRAAQVVLEKVRDIGPKQVEVKFGIKVSGTANWLVAKAATEGNFEITLTWEPGAAGEAGPPVA